MNELVAELAKNATKKIAAECRKWTWRCDDAKRIPDALHDFAPAIIQDALIAASEWRDIETAPKDQKILLACPGNTGVVVGQWQSDCYAKRPRPYWTNDMERIWGISATRQRQPTHWLPLPAPPTQGTPRESD